MAPPVAVGVLTLLVTLAPVPELVPELVPEVVPEIVAGLVALGVGTVSGGVPRLVKLLALEDRILTGPGPVGSTPLVDGITEVIVSVRAGLAKVSVMTVVTHCGDREGAAGFCAAECAYDTIRQTEYVNSRVALPVDVPGSPDECAGTVVISRSGRNENLTIRMR